MEKEQQKPEDNTGKISLMMDLLSQERKEETGKHISETLMKVISKGSLKDVVGKQVEFTIAFDKEEPKQYLYVKGVFLKFNPEQMDGIVANIVEHSGNALQFAMIDAEVYKEENAHNWLDHRSRIEEQAKNDSTLVYDDNVTGAEKYPENKNDIDPEGVSEKEMYDYYDANIPKYSIEDYINKFEFVTKMLINRMMESYLNRNKITVHAALGYNIELVKGLQNYFSAVDFTEFTKDELTMIGMI